MTALAYVSAASGNVDASGTTAATASWSLTTGNHVFVYVRWEAASAPTITLSDTAGNTYTALTQAWSGSVGGKWFYCLNATGNAANVVTATFSTAAQYKNVRAITLSGSTPSVVLDSTTSSSASTRIALTTPVTNGAGAMLLAGESSINADFTRAFSGVGGGWTNVGAGYFYAETSYKACPSGVNTFDPPIYTADQSSSGRVLMLLNLDIGGSVPAITTKARLSQTPVEVLRTNLAVKARVSQTPVEVLRTNTGVKVRTSQIALEILRPNSAPLVTGRRTVCSTT